MDNKFTLSKLFINWVEKKQKKVQKQSKNQLPKPILHNSNTNTYFNKISFFFYL